MGTLIVIHKPAGYEGWKDEQPIPRPNIKAIVYIVLSIFACGFTCASTATVVYFQRRNSNPPPVAMVATATSVPTINVIQQSPPTIVVSPTPQPTVKATVAVSDLQATLDYLKTLPTFTPQPEPIAVVTSEPIFCDGSTFENYTVGSTLRVNFDDVGALRLLDGPRLRDKPAPQIVRQLYDGNLVRIEGNPVCGFWNGEPVVYYPVYAIRWNERGFVGFGHNSDVWLVG